MTKRNTMNLAYKWSMLWNLGGSRKKYRLQWKTYMGVWEIPVNYKLSAYCTGWYGKQPQCSLKSGERRQERKLGTKTPGVPGSRGGLQLGTVLPRLMEPDCQKHRPACLVHSPFSITDLSFSSLLPHLSLPRSPIQFLWICPHLIAFAHMISFLEAANLYHSSLVIHPQHFPSRPIRLRFPFHGASSHLDSLNFLFSRQNQT